MLEVEEDEFDRLYAINVKSIYLFAQAAVPQMRTQGRGMILNIGSTAGLRPRPGLVWYNGTKGPCTLTKSMAVELAPEGIRVCALAPVAGETPLLAAFLGEDTPERRAAFARLSRSAASRAGGHRQRGAVPGFGGGGFHHRRRLRGRCGRCI